MGLRRSQRRRRRRRRRRRKIFEMICNSVSSNSGRNSVSISNMMMTVSVEIVKCVE